MLRLFLAAVLVALSMPAAAHQMPCGPTAAMMEVVGDLGEVQISTGEVGGGFPIVTYVNPENGDWSILAHLPDGTTCALASGSGYRLLSPGEDSTKISDPA